MQADVRPRVTTGRDAAEQASLSIGDGREAAVDGVDGVDDGVHVAPVARVRELAVAAHAGDPPVGPDEDHRVRAAGVYLSLQDAFDVLGVDHAGRTADSRMQEVEDGEA